jgi:lysyl-tRNA synthetase class 1
MAETGIPVPPWAKKVADGLGAGPHVVVTGISPSGHIHNLREVLVAEAVANALRARGESVRFLFHADTIDPLRKVAPGVPASFEEFFGHSLSRVPDPEGCHASYAEHFLVPFEEALHKMGMDIEVLRSHELYEAGVYTDVTREAIEHTDELREILAEVSGRTLLVEDYWSPYVPRDSRGSLHNTRVIEHIPESNKVLFEQVRPEDGTVEVREADYSKGDGKLQWRVELAARWKALGVTFEPFGKDHTSRGGSTDTADRMSREIFRYPVPGRFEYEWNYIKGKGAMSSSKGIVLMPQDLLRIMPPAALRRFFLGPNPARALEMDLGEGFPRFMDRFNAEQGGTNIPFKHLALVAQTASDSPRGFLEAEKILRRDGYVESTRNPERLRRDLAYARNWARDWAPESMRMQLLSEEEAFYNLAQLDEEQRGYLADISSKLRPGMEGDEIQDLLYSTAVGRGLKPKRAFAAVYKVLLGKTSGPKAGPFVAGLPPEEVRRRFSE